MEAKATRGLDVKGTSDNRVRGADSGETDLILQRENIQIIINIWGCAKLKQLASKCQ
jgi:hypothetical protein